MTGQIKSGIVGALFITFVCLLLSSCNQSRPAYILKGRVISKQLAAQQLIIDNDDIPGFMPAMTMPYTVKDPKGFDLVQPADIIRADIMQGPDGSFWLEHLAVTGKSKDTSTAKGTAAQVLAVGEKVPDFSMVNQDGKTIHFNQFKGKMVLLTFVYTRCPFPDYCPLITRQFQTIQKELAKTPDDYKRTHLLSISLDPAYDKPPVLREYGLSNMDHDPKGFQHWDFVSTTPADLQKITDSFGISISDENSQISHSLNTVLVASDGTVAQMWPGNDWQTSEVLDVMRHTLMVSK